MHCFRYRMDHDYGFAPNPFWGNLTLATCKAQIRKNRNLSIGDWIVGLGSKKLGNEGCIIYAGCVNEIILFDQYWEDSRFQVKKANVKGSLLQMYGDNVYHTVDGSLVQEHCAHSIDASTPNERHLESDASGQNVLICRRFYYFGDRAPHIPSKLSYIADTGNPRAIRYTDLDNAKIDAFISWLEANFSEGVHGDPCNWKEFNIPKMDIYEGEESPYRP